MNSGKVILAMVLMTGGWVLAKPLPPRFKFAESTSIVLELKQVPRPGPFIFQAMPPVDFPAELVLPVKYRADYQTFEDMKKRVEKEPGKFPLRAAVFLALRTLKDSEGISLRQTFPRHVKLDAKAKMQILNEQKDVGAAAFHLESVLAKMVQLGKERRAKEPSPRWQAHYDYLLAAVQARLIFCYEFNFLLAQIRAENMSELGPGHTGWRVTAQPDPRNSESTVKNHHRDLLRNLKKLESDHPQTPWALVAAAEQRLDRGLTWQPSRD